ncbi:MAG: hypothetical protein AAGJ79_15190 [Verrucomicrobiota bacterium]
MKVPLNILGLVLAGLLCSSCHPVSGHAHTHGHGHSHGPAHGQPVKVRMTSGVQKPHMTKYGGSRTYVSTIHNRRRLSYRSYSRMKARARARAKCP